MTSQRGFTAPVHVRWSDIDMYQHINHATMVTILEEARVPFLREPFGAEITTIGLLIAEVNIIYKSQLRLVDSPLQVTMWSKRVRAVDFTVGYEVRSVGAPPNLSTTWSTHLRHSWLASPCSGPARPFRPAETA